ncbi:hypothetical protein O1R50_23165 [Glycomyces luteolus]|uniref:Lipoprotein n=1 Tax=Glycomyces luteolus TaxID=2670330 RepID=A0A9X3PCE4_9ACTN|nr:hypothetical protein [Glycomyces luteolus]MDA1362542.1 hypothetical protein [Glycomyces luteolus]
MRKFAALVPLSAVLLVAACQSGGTPEEGGETTSAPATVETAPPVLDPAVAASVSFELPAQMTENTTVPFPYLLGYEHTSWSYDIGAEGLGPDDRIFVTSYLMPEGTTYPDYESSLAFIREYDALIVNDAHEASHNPALINRQEGIFRFAVLRIGERTLYQRNFFLFNENHVVQVTCQWENTRAILIPFCEEMQETLTLK